MIFDFGIFASFNFGLGANLCGGGFDCILREFSKKQIDDANPQPPQRAQSNFGFFPSPAMPFAFAPTEI
jgi:hypothetical protein